MGTAEMEQYDRRYSPDEPMRVRQNLVSRSRVERSAFGVLDARVEIERSLFRSPRVIDTLRPRQRINVLVIKIEIAVSEPSCEASGIPAERIFRSDLRKLPAQTSPCGRGYRAKNRWSMCWLRAGR